MSDESKFFRYLWRFLAIGLALVVLGTLAFIGLGLKLPAGPVGHHAPDAKKVERKWTYRIEGEDLATNWAQSRKLFVLRRWSGEPREFGLSSYSGPDAQDVNYLFVNGQTGASQWVFRGNNRLIVSNDSITAGAPNFKGVSLSIAIVTTVVESDTDKDGELSTKDRKTLYGYHIGGVAPAKMLSADTILGARQIDDDKYLIAYMNGKALKAAVFSIADFKMVSERPIPNVPN